MTATAARATCASFSHCVRAAESRKSPQNSDFYGHRTTYSEKAHCIKDSVLLDPCCGSGGMFVQSEKFVNAHSDVYRKQGSEFDNLFDKVVSIYGQESNQTTWRLCKMNLAIRGIDSSNVRWNNEGSFLNDAHQDLKADFIIANEAVICGLTPEKACNFKEFAA
jgi:hypothetical protein